MSPGSRPFFHFLPPALLHLTSCSLSRFLQFFVLLTRRFSPTFAPPSLSLSLSLPLSGKGPNCDRNSNYTAQLCSNSPSPLDCGSEITQFLSTCLLFLSLCVFTSPFLVNLSKMVKTVTEMYNKKLYLRAVQNLIILKIYIKKKHAIISQSSLFRYIG